MNTSENRAEKIQSREKRWGRHASAPESSFLHGKIEFESPNFDVVPLNLMSDEGSKIVLEET